MMEVSSTNFARGDATMSPRPVIQEGSFLTLVQVPTIQLTGRKEQLSGRFHNVSCERVTHKLISQDVDDAPTSGTRHSVTPVPSLVGL